MPRLRRLTARVLCQIGRTADRVARLSHYLAVGTLRLEDMKDDIRHSWQDFYNRDPVCDRGLMPWEEELVERFVPTGASVLVVGCGSGRDLLALAERGCQVTGVDPASSALHTAQRVLLERRLSATLVEGFFEDTPLSGHFDVVIFSYYCYSFIPESRQRIEALRKAVALLKPGGHILISYAHTVRPRLVLIGLARLMGALCRSDWRLEAGDVVRENRQGPPSYSYTHAFESGEVEKEAAAAGLRPVFHRDAGDSQVLALARL